MSVNKSRAMYLSDGTAVAFVKVTTKNNIQVRVPTSHPLGAADPLRIFNPTTGRHYKDAIALTLTNTPKAVNASQPLFLSDGTPVTFVKTTSKRNIQVRVPSSNPLGAADPLRIFKPSDGQHYKNATNGIFLTNTGSAAAAAPAVAAAASDDVTYSVTVGGRTTTRKTFEGAESVALSLLSASVRSVEIVESRATKRVVGTVGVNTTRAS